MPKSKNSQIIGNAFIYVFSVVVVGLMLIFGYKYIYSTEESIAKTEFALFKDKIASDINGISSDYGSSKKVSYPIPENNELCLFDLGQKLEILNDEKINSYKLIKNSIEGDVRKNVFLIGNNIFEPFYIGEIEINEPYFYCFKPIAGRVSFIIEGLGNRTLILLDT